MSNKQMGSSIDDFLKEEGVFEESQVQAIKEVVVWQLAKVTRKKKISKKRMAAMLKTSRTQVDRLLNTESDITLGSLQRAARAHRTRLAAKRIDSIGLSPRLTESALNGYSEPIPPCYQQGAVYPKIGHFEQLSWQTTIPR